MHKPSLPDYRSESKVKKELSDYSSSDLKLRYIESILQGIQDNTIRVDRTTREMLQDTAIHVWENSPEDVRKRSQVRMEYILQVSREFEAELNNAEKATKYGEILESIVEEEIGDRETKNRTSLVTRAAAIAGIASGVVFFSASSITGNVVLGNSNALLPQSAIAIGIGILVVAAVTLLSRKR